VDAHGGPSPRARAPALPDGGGRVGCAAHARQQGRHRRDTTTLSLGYTREKAEGCTPLIIQELSSISAGAPNL